MIEKLRALLKSSPEEKTAISLELASAALLMEIAFADYDCSEQELLSLRKTLTQTYKLEDAAIDGLITEAKAAHTDAVSMYPYVEVINNTCTPEDKLKLLQSLWQIAYADGHLDKFEEHYIRKIADLIYVPHRGFMQAKRLVLDAMKKD